MCTPQHKAGRTSLRSWLFCLPISPSGTSPFFRGQNIHHTKKQRGTSADFKYANNNNKRTLPKQNAIRRTHRTQQFEGANDVPLVILRANLKQLKHARPRDDIIHRHLVRLGEGCRHVEVGAVVNREGGESLGRADFLQRLHEISTQGHEDEVKDGKVSF